MNDKTDQNRRSAPAEIVAMADQIRSFCSAITKIARADLQSHLESHDFGIGAIEHGVLRHLSHSVTSMAEISRLMGVAPSTLVYVVDGLEKKNLVKRSKDPNDRRREPLLLTKRGADLFARIPGMERSSLLVKSLESMKETGRRELLKLLNEFVEGLPGSEMHLRPESEETNGASAASQEELITSGAKVRRRSHA
jgi:DNA-binding MarR family transcriptional regulator